MSPYLNPDDIKFRALHVFCHAWHLASGLGQPTLWFAQQDVCMAACPVHASYVVTTACCPGYPCHNNMPTPPIPGPSTCSMLGKCHTCPSHAFHVDSLDMWATCVQLEAGRVHCALFKRYFEASKTRFWPFQGCQWMKNRT